MFERYTEKARQCIFFARYEASQSGSREIGAEALLLGIAKADRGLFLRLGTNIDWMSVKDNLASPQGPPSAASVEMPLSEPAKRVLTYAGEEHERLHHPCIECRHILLGILRESDSAAAQFLRDQQIDRERILADFQAVPPEPHAGEPPTPGMPPAIRRRLEEMREEFGALPGQINGFGSTWSSDSEGGPNGRVTAGRTEDGGRVTKTRQFYDGHEITTIERTRLNEDGATLSYSIDITGPGGETHRYAMDFPVAGPSQPK